jgi:hypothetical protein
MFKGSKVRGADLFSGIDAAKLGASYYPIFVVLWRTHNAVTPQGWHRQHPLCDFVVLWSVH